MAILKNLLLFLAGSSLLAQPAQGHRNGPMGTSTVALEAAALPTSFAAAVQPQDATALLQIQQTLSTYAFIIDGKQYEQLGRVFHDNVWANYSALIGSFHPLSVLQVGLRRSLAQVTSQHALASPLIHVADDGRTARSATYFTASHFGIGEFYGQALWGWGTYEDNWVKDSTGQWKIIERTIAYPGPLIGNLSIFGDMTAAASPQLDDASLSTSLYNVLRGWVGLFSGV
ncbi:MAG: hypothetical protein M1818_002860 [Claussenomyces sp. TS43310]|nr:MAG: hypothetical protein M1818_002860 [Claussenomyces sp. TS43310]